MICPTGEAKYFCKGDWTGGITLIRFNKFGFTRKRDPLAEPSFRGVSEANEPGIHNHDREYGFRACAKRRIPE
jgi:hypothetical protein